MLSLTERRLKLWERHELIEPREMFALSDLIALRALMKLERDHVPPKKIRMALSAVRARLRDVTDPLKEVKVLADGKRIRVEVGGHHMEPLSGQLLFNFDGEELRRLLSFPQGTKERETRGKRESAERYFQQGLEHEQRGALEDAVTSYQTAVGLGFGIRGSPG